MPLANYNTFCFAIAAEPGAVCISFPGGGEICAAIPSLIPVGGMELAQDVMAKLNTALAPLQPTFNIIDAILAIFDCVKATATLDPEKIVECLPNLAQRINALLKLIPQLSLPALLAGFLQNLALYLRGLINNLLRQQEYALRILAAQTAAANTDIILGPILDCATGDLDRILIFQGEQAAPINRIIGIINSFLKLLNLPCIPEIGSPTLTDGFIQLLRDLIDFLNYLASLLSFELPFSLRVSADDC